MVSLLVCLNHPKEKKKNFKNKSEFTEYKGICNFLDERTGFNTSVKVDYLDDIVESDIIVTEDVSLPLRAAFNLPKIGPIVAQDNLDADVSADFEDPISKVHARICANQPIVKLTRLETNADQSNINTLLETIAGIFENNPTEKKNCFFNYFDFGF